MAELQDLIREEVAPGLYDQVFTKKFWFNGQPFAPRLDPHPGDWIEKDMRVAVENNGGTYTRSDADAASDGETVVTAKFNTIRIHGATELNNVDIINGRGSNFGDYIQERTKTALNNLYSNACDALSTRLSNLIDSTTAFSDAALNRSTYPVLASGEDADAEAITLADFTAQTKALFISNEVTESRSDYGAYFAASVYNTFYDLVKATGTIQANLYSNETLRGGIQGGINYDGIDCMQVQGLTTGHIYLLYKPGIDLRIVSPLRTEIKQMNKDASMLNFYMWINLAIDYPGVCAKLAVKS